MNSKDFENLKANGKSIVFVWGDFNILHPGHLRLLNFAADCGDVLIVGIRNDDVQSVIVSSDIRLQSLRYISIVDYAFVLESDPIEFIKSFKPNVVVKGKEHKSEINAEKQIIESYGGELIFSSGESKFSSLDYLKRSEGWGKNNILNKPDEYLSRHNINEENLIEIVKKFSNLKVVVVGDLIVDEYINCDPLGMSQEDPTIVVTPVSKDIFVGGAGIVAAHATGLGADVHYLTISGVDLISEYALNELKIFNVNAHFFKDHTRPTTLKQRYRARGKTLLRVSELKQHEISDEISEKILNKIQELVLNVDLLIFSDFNYGCLPQHLVDKIIEICNSKNIPMFADSQSSSQIGNISRYKGMKLLTPTEHEARLALVDSDSGLVTLAEKLSAKALCDYVFITMGSEGLFIHSPRSPSNKIITDSLPALNSNPRDVAGAGDSMLICTALALVAGANVWEAAYLGSIAAGCQVGRVGNKPLTDSEIIEVLL